MTWIKLYILYSVSVMFTALLRCKCGTNRFRTFTEFLFWINLMLWSIPAIVDIL